jgi:LL-diaminopimelate aminotransferase
VRCSRRLAELPSGTGHPGRGAPGLLDLTGAAAEPLAPEAAAAILARAAASPEAQRAGPPAGLAAFRRAVAAWYGERHGVDLDPETQVLALSGARQGLFLAAFAACDPGDVVLVPDPCGGAGRVGAYFAGAEVVSLPVRPGRDYLPELGTVPEAVLRRARLLFLHYPHNPTGAVAPAAFLQAAVAFARRHALLLCNDFAYGDVGYDGYRPRSLLSVDGALRTALEFMTLSESCGLPGWRLGAAVGAAPAVAALARLVAHVTGGPPGIVQLAGAEVLGQAARSGFLTARNETYRARRDLLAAALEEAGVPLRRPRAGPFLWVPCPDGLPSARAARWLAERFGVAATPGAAFGPAGEGFLRLSLDAPTAAVEEAAARLRRAGAGALVPAAGAAPRPSPAATLPPPAAAGDGPDLLGCL